MSEKIKRKGRKSTMLGHKGLKGYSKDKVQLWKPKKNDGSWTQELVKAGKKKQTKIKAAEQRAIKFSQKERAQSKSKPGPPKFSKAFKKSAKKQAIKRVAKGAAKTALRSVGPIAAVLTAAEIARGAVKVGKSIKARASCKKSGGIYKGGFCVTSKSIKKKVLGK